MDMKFSQQDKKVDNGTQFVVRTLKISKDVFIYNGDHISCLAQDMGLKLFPKSETKMTAEEQVSL